MVYGASVYTRQPLLIHQPLLAFQVARKVETTLMAIMFTQRIILCLALLILTAETLAQCSDPNSQPCSASQSNDVVEADLAATEVNDGLAALFAAAGVGIHRFFRRQDTVDGSPKLCCSQNTECLSIAGVPYCYVRTLNFLTLHHTLGFELQSLMGKSIYRTQ